MLVRERIYDVALEKGLRQSTLTSYLRLLDRLGILDKEVEAVTRERVAEALWAIDNLNTRRAAVIAVRSVLGLPVRIPKSIPRRYDLASEDTLRIALMTSPHEVRGLLMMYGGLRIGEACAITRADVAGDRLRVDKQVLEVFRTGQPTVLRTGPVNSTEAEVVIPVWLAERVDSLEDIVKPGSVRESLRRAGTKVGTHINPHMLRHWYASAMLARGVPLSLVSKQMRHSDIATTLRTYSQHDDGVIHEVFG